MPHHFPPGTPPALDMQHISKAFDGKPALVDASFTLAWGEVHALVGENGAGKSTLMSIATGVYTADDGTQLVDGENVLLRAPADATAAGLGMVHQHFRLVSRFTVAENILLALGDSGAAQTVHDAAALVREKADEIGLSVRPEAVVGDLSIAERQRAEIIKVLLLGARIVILDEPTAVLTEGEASALLSFTRRLAEQGHAVVLITHKLREVMAESDRVTVMRAGRTVMEGARTSGVDIDEVARLAVGDHIASVEIPDARPGEARLSVENLTVRCADGTTPVEGLSLELRAGEVLGVAGVGGNGQQELVDCLSGMSAPTGGRILLQGKDVASLTIRERRNLGLRIVPSDRFATGLVRDMSIADNLAMTSVGDGTFGGFFLLNHRKMRDWAGKVIEQFDVLGAAPTRMAGLLSGGNAQKVLLARELDAGMRVLVAHSPARGLDVKATRAVHALIKDVVERGGACLLISEDLEEVLGLSNRIAVMNRGRISGEAPAGEATAEWIGARMIGHA